MKLFSLILALFVTASFSLLAADTEAGAKKSKQEKPAKEAKVHKPKGKLYHVVSFKFKASATPEQIQKVEAAFAALKDKVSEVNTLEWGTNVSTEKHDKGFTHCFVLGFKTAKARDAYLVHPEHKAFVEIVGPVMEDAFVIDFWGQK